MNPILVVVEDLIFLSKIRETARLVNVAIEVVAAERLKEALAAAAAPAVICDLNYRGGLALEAVRALKSCPRLQSIPVVGFLSHVQADIAAAAKEAGCDVVMARSAFSAQLPQLLRKYAEGGEAPAVSPSVGHAQ